MSEFKFNAEAMAFNLCNDFPVEFVEKNERFARAVIAEYERQRAQINPDPVREAAHDLLEALQNLLAVHEGQGGTRYHAGDIARAAIRKATEG
jgi:hypothetical protein